jgi:hypothetical protein
MDIRCQYPDGRLSWVDITSAELERYSGHKKEELNSYMMRVQDIIASRFL